MTQLIENKPPRRALIATLSHFCASRRRFVGRSFSSDITRVARTRYRCAGSLAACTRSTVQGFYGRIQPPASGLPHREPNRNIRRLETHLTPAKSIRGPRLIATKSHLANSRFRRGYRSSPVADMRGECLQSGASGSETHLCEKEAR
jgi:hypothetical protein